MKTIAFIVLASICLQQYFIKSQNFGFQVREDDVHECCSDSLYLPALDTNDTLIAHFAFKLVYSEEHEQAKWVYHKLLKENLSKPKVKRSNSFKQDPLIHTGSATSADYRNSGFDRGHLAPAADMAWSKRTMDESFYYSNMSPQAPSFNRGIWKRLETQVRSWAMEYDSVFVVSGPILYPGLESIGSNVSVPEFYFKTVLRYDEGKPLSVAFLLPNAGNKSELNVFAISVDSLESFSGINFNASLDSTLQSTIESQVCLKCWEWE